MNIRHTRALDISFPTFPAWPFLSVTAHPLAEGLCPIRRHRRDLSEYRMEVVPWRYDEEHDLNNQWILTIGAMNYVSDPVIKGQRMTAANRVAGYKGD